MAKTFAIVIMGDTLLPFSCEPPPSRMTQQERAKREAECANWHDGFRQVYAQFCAYREEPPQ